MSALNFANFVADDFAQVDAIIRQQLSSRISLINTIGDYLLSAGGKRLRPLVVLLIGNALSCTDERLHQVATIIEFLHTSTLLHDDVVDESNKRRGRLTANANWGNAPAVLVGDFLYARSFEMIVELNNQDIAKVMANATRILAEGEVLQLTQVHNVETSESTYLDIIRSKTATLFETAAHCVAILTAQNEAQTQNLRMFGDCLGIAFQLTDDVLDYISDNSTLGKNVGDDLAEGKPTLPLIHALNNGSSLQKQIICDAVLQGSGDLSQIKQIVENSGSLTYTTNLAKKYATKACSNLASLPDNSFKQILLDLTNFAVNRSN